MHLDEPVRRRHVVGERVSRLVRCTKNPCLRIRCSGPYAHALPSLPHGVPSEPRAGDRATRRGGALDPQRREPVEEVERVQAELHRAVDACDVGVPLRQAAALRASVGSTTGRRPIETGAWSRRGRGCGSARAPAGQLEGRPRASSLFTCIRLCAEEEHMTLTACTGAPVLYSTRATRCLQHNRREAMDRTAPGFRNATAGFLSQADRTISRFALSCTACARFKHSASTNFLIGNSVRIRQLLQRALAKACDRDRAAARPGALPSMWARGATLLLVLPAAAFDSRTTHATLLEADVVALERALERRR